jgi:hypothetical protein
MRLIEMLDTEIMPRAFFVSGCEQRSINVMLYG